MLRIITVLLGLAVVGSGSLRAEDFALKDQDTVVFLGDSITAARTYGKLVENYTLLRFPDRDVRFINAGLGGETADRARARLQADVIDQGATVVTVAYGINDIAWGFKADDEHRTAYLEGIRGIVTRCREKGIRVYVCSAAVTSEDPARSETGFFKKMCDEGMQVAREAGGQSIDVQGSMREVQRRIQAFNKAHPDAKEPLTLHTADGVHLSELGQVAFAHALLKGLNAPAEVSSVKFDAVTEEADASGCEISGFSGDKDGVEFVREDHGLPFNGPAFFALHHAVVPIPETLNQYLLTVTSLSPGKYDVVVDDRLVTTVSHEELARGLNLASMTPDAWHPGGPWEAQARVLWELTDSRHHLDEALKTANQSVKFSSPDRWAAQLTTSDQKLVTLQREITQPRSYRFEIRKAKPRPAP